MDKKQTAVDWLINQVNSENYQNAFGQTYISVAVIEQAKQMEKEQILDAYGVVETTEQGDIMNAEQYYNETYNSKQ